MAFRAPLLGYNTNVRHKGKLYHIQTEDSGVDHPHVITHLFADGGRIVASKKTSYADRVGSDGLPDQVKKLMQGQHKAMFISLRDGLYDEDASDEPHDAPRSGAIDLAAVDARTPAEPSVTEAQPAESRLAESSAEVSLGAPTAGEAHVTASERADEHVAHEQAAHGQAADSVDHDSDLPEPITEVADADGPRVNMVGANDPSSADAAEGALPPAEDKPKERAPVYQATKPVQPALRLADAGPRVEAREVASARRADARAAAADHAERPPASQKANDGPRSLFGGDLLSDKSLDEVILNYLAANEKDA